jgi:hypothetical protein
VTPELIEFLCDWRPESSNTAEFVIQKNFFRDLYVSHGGWGNDWLLRIFNRSSHQFNDSPVHENISLTKSSKKEYLPNPIEHNAIQDIGQFLVKFDRYTEIRRHETPKTFYPVLIALRSLFAFLRSYIRRAGFLEGWRALVIAWY